MCSRHLRTALALLVAASLMLAGVAFAQGKMPRLPKPYGFPQAGDSPGRVTFNHESHVDENAPDCTACHPRLFKILKPGATPDRQAITHDAMNQGQACGSCHNGKKSFGFDDCTLCHRSQ